MLSFNLLGSFGRLGNQMFQYAALYSLARRAGTEHCIPPSKAEDLRREHQLFQVFKLPALKFVGAQKDVPILAEASLRFDSNLYEKRPSEGDLRGFFQSEKYFCEVADEIRAEFSFRNQVEAYCRNVIAQFKRPTVSLHVRRGDYLAQSNQHPPCSMDYYTEAATKFDPSFPILVFSDDIAWCKKQALFSTRTFVFIDGHPNFLDLCLMTHCSHHIIANSSFSWWGAWLGRNEAKQVIAPKRWFGETDQISNEDAADVIPSRWLRI